jgi:hypothetical protein
LVRFLGIFPENDGIDEPTNDQPCNRWLGAQVSAFQASARCSSAARSRSILGAGRWMRSLDAGQF